MASLSRRLFVLLLLCECIALLAVILVLASAEPTRRWPLVALIAGTAVLIAIVLIPAVRTTAYRQCVPYNPHGDFHYDLSRMAGASAAVTLEEHGFDWPKIDGQFDTAILAFSATATWRGRWCDPFLEVQCGGAAWRQYFERGVSGQRFLDMTPYLTEPSKTKQRVHLRSKHLRWGSNAKLFLIQNDVPPDTRILVVAPHPDDAEIAAFGVYEQSDSSIVTLCAGNEGAHLYRQSRGHHVGSADLPTAVRVRESITVPFLAGVHPSRCANLCYADNSLADLYAGRNSAVAGTSLRLPEAPQLRALNLATGMFHAGRLPESWSSLIADLSEVIAAATPAVILLPHPLLESHLDHCYAAVAIVEAVRQSAQNDSRFMFYVVHPRANESHPLGPSGTAGSLPPNIGPAVEVNGIFSHWLMAGQQSLKMAALESMSDLRATHSHEAGWKGALKDLLGRWYEDVSGCPRNPHSFFRRAVRPNELFFTATFAEAQRIVDQFLQQSADAVKHSRV